MAAPSPGRRACPKLKRNRRTTRQWSYVFFPTHTIIVNNHHWWISTEDTSTSIQDSFFWLSPSSHMMIDSLERFVILGQVGEWGLRAHDACSAVFLHPQIVVQVVLLLIRLLTAGAAGFLATLFGLLLFRLLPEGQNKKENKIWNVKHACFGIVPVMSN